jgi:DNA-binding response OmpR family regulator
MQSIVIVEDNETLARLYAHVLSLENYIVVTFPTAREALDYIRRNHVDLMLLDVMLPGGMNGFDLLEQIKKDPALSYIIVVMMTNLDEEKETGLKIGATDYLIKSNMKIEDLIAKMRSLLPSAA